MNRNESMIDVSRFFEVIKKNLIGIIACGLAGVIVSLIVSFFMITPKYDSTVDILVNQKSSNNAMQFNMQQADLQAINTYKDVLKKSVILTPVLKEVRKRDNYQGTLDDLQKSIKITNQTNSQVISVTVTDKNAYIATDIANTIGKVFTREIKKMMQVDNVTVVTKASVNTKPVSPKKKLNVFIGIVIGLALGIIIAIIRDLRDTTVKGTDFLEELGLINLGVAYHISGNSRNYRVVDVIEDADDNSEMHRRV
ncbi:Wzz/FepE/Etk N-terminal domain-containing protein [Ligilactobacillus animalis]|uniref:YveK family protein n=1 Tax=Ligilactobacillus animalis TaxID=1605 RepID=UPI0029005A91|nr:Wzz/FepE/Etk N-terminal domain-containing protein [Ligilactobacillus animalis]MDU1487487.1 Wzz/FepE/Etk N-terminal domain-containing protein [Ligilactobacillus animalis]